MLADFLVASERDLYRRAAYLIVMYDMEDMILKHVNRQSDQFLAETGA